MLLYTPQNIAGNYSLWRCEIAPGNIHRKYLNLGWVLAIPISFWFASFMSTQGYSYFFSFVFCIWNYFLCRIVDMDLDLISTNTSEAYGMQLLAKIPIIGWVLRAFWISLTTFYAAMIMPLGGHRSFFSHSLVIGTGGRIIFFSIPIYLGLRYYHTMNGGIWDWNEVYLYWNMQYWLYPYYLSLFWTWSLGDAIHLLLDAQFVKGVLYQPVTSNSEQQKEDYFKPRYGKFITALLKVVLGYSYSKIEGIKNLRKR